MGDVDAVDTLDVVTDDKVENNESAIKTETDKVEDFDNWDNDPFADQHDLFGTEETVPTNENEEAKEESLNGHNDDSNSSKEKENNIGNKIENENGDKIESIEPAPSGGKIKDDTTSSLSEQQTTQKAVSVND